ncbi:MAG TPA: Uma2 family endonuclease, partial [Isosphaeraceae bacterium]|nr:Uma2 family endonuclease [Isosphaeraceae bacterium]
MSVIVTDPCVEDRILAERKASGGDRFDEVWNGVYWISPLPGMEHQRIATQLATILQVTIGWSGLGEVFNGINVSDREQGWEQNFRCPDVAVILYGGRARSHGAFCLSGPDFIVEILSPGDRAHEKIPFYSHVGVRELLLIDRDPWVL